jgi:hypothetical protein
MDAMAKGQVILVGFAESLAAPESCWSLIDAGYEVVAFARDGADVPLRQSKTVRVVSVAAPEENAKASLNALTELIRQLRPTAILPLDDAAVWMLAHAEQDVEFVAAGPVGQQAEFALDKTLQVAAALEAGFGVPDTTVECAGSISVDDLPYPVYLRPALAVEAHSSHLHRAHGGLCTGPADALGLLGGIHPSSPMLIQPAVVGEGRGIFGLADANGLRAASAHRRVRMVSPSGSGSSACRPAPVPSDLHAATQRLLELASWRGMFMVEYLVDASGAAWFVEFNGRAWGSMALARHLGLEYPAWTVQQALGEPVTAPTTASSPRDFVCRHLGRELIHLMRVLRGPRHPTQQWPSKIATLGSMARLKRSDRWYNNRRGERRVLIADTFYTLRRFFR